MLPDYWQLVHRLVIVCLDDFETVVQLNSALQIVRSTLPKVHITLLTCYSSSQLTSLLHWSNEVLTDEVLTCSEFGDVVKLIRVIRDRQFDAAIIFTEEGRSPYALAYICYLAGVPVRLGQSQEFGGSVLSHCIKPSEENVPQARHLSLLKSAGFWFKESDTKSMPEHLKTG